MPIDDPLDLERIDQEIRINELRHQAEELGEMTHWESDSFAGDQAEAFWRHVVAWETAPITSYHEKLRREGIEMPAPESMTDAALTAKLWQVIHWLADQRCFLSCTDHLNDRELYEHLWIESFHEQIRDMPYDKDMTHYLDILGGCSEEDLFLQMKHYASEEDRRRWLEQFPDDEMPAHEDPPYDRDRHLPNARD